MVKFTTALFSAVLVVCVSSVPVRRDVDPSLVPSLGATAGKNPTGTGDCDGAANGADGKPIKVPCTCPPDQATFLAALNKNVAAGKAVNNPSIAVTFPTDNSVASQQARINTALVTLQNLNGPGQGCPASSTTLVAQQKALASGGAAPAPAPAAPAPAPAAPAPAAPAAPAPPAAAAPAASGGALSTAQLDPLTPQFGVTPNTNPTGTGDCDGINGIKIPCACPPDRQTFLTSLQGNIAAGKAVNNPSVAVSFPTDNSPASQRARIQASLVTLQNLNGSGKGCPASSTTFSAQLAAVQG